jgi:hypothetical protein
MMRSVPYLLPIASALALAACLPVASSSAPSAPRSGASSRPPTPAISPLPTPAGSAPLPFPTAFAAELVPGRYSSSPPFDLPFTFQVAEVGWVAGHLHGEFFDIQHYEGRRPSGAPARVLAWALPAFVRGSADVPASDLTPAAAIDLLADRVDIVDSNRAEVALLGRRGARLDLHAIEDNTPVFGGPGGTFGLSVAHDVRLVALPIEGGLLLLLVSAEPDELEAVWLQSLEIIESMEL